MLSNGLGARADSFLSQWQVWGPDPRSAHHLTGLYTASRRHWETIAHRTASNCGHFLYFVALWALPAVTQLGKISKAKFMINSCLGCIFLVLQAPMIDCCVDLLQTPQSASCLLQFHLLLDTVNTLGIHTWENRFTRVQFFHQIAKRQYVPQSQGLYI